MSLKPFVPSTRPVLILLTCLIGLQALIAAFSDGPMRFIWRSSLPPLWRLYLYAPPVFGAVTVLQGALFLAFTIMFLVWIYRLSAQLHAQSETRMAFTPGWSVGWFFIPLANLLMPYLVLRDLWVTVRQDPRRKGSVLLWWWWFWIPSVVLSIATRLLIDYPFLSRDIVRPIDLAAQFVAVVAPLLLLAMIVAMARSYARCFRDVEAGAASAPLPAPVAAEHVASGWYPDPSGRHESRFWDGSTWTEAVSSRGLHGADPM